MKGWAWVAGCMLVVGCTDRQDEVPATPADGGAQDVGAGASAGGGAANQAPAHVQVRGSAQKGPLVLGSSVNVFGLDSALDPTGTVFPSQTKDSLGSFDVSTNLTEEMVEVVVQGPFYDELTLKLSETSIVLRALATAAPDTNVRVNLLTTASKNRIRYLVGQGQAFDEAVAQAEEEVLSAFGIEAHSLEAFTEMDITGSTTSDAALIAISAILLEYADEHSDSSGEKVALLGRAVSSIASDLEQDGVLDDTELGVDISTAAERLDIGRVTANLRDIYAELGQSISVPDIAPFVAAVAGPGDVPDPNAVPVRVGGRAQNGAAADVNVFGLDSTLVPTGTVFPTRNNDNLGSFELRANLAEKLIEIVVQGHFTNVLTGFSSETEIVLRALAAATPETNAGVNFLTTLSTNRIRYLVGQGQAFDAAVAQAENEVLSAFGIEDDSLAPFTTMNMPGSSASDAALIAVSVILHYYAQWHRENLALAIATIASDLEQDGVLDKQLRVELSAAADMDVAAVTATLAEIYSDLGQSVAVPDIGPFVRAAASRLPWQRAPNMPQERIHHCACAVGDKIYVIGGNASSTIVNDVVQYDLATGQWGPRSPSPTPRAYSTCSVVDDVLYVTGGSKAVGGQLSGDRTSTVEAYDPAQDAWTTKAAMPFARGGHASTTLDGKMYVAGGATTQPIDDVLVYDPAQDAWTPVAPLPKKLDGLSLSAVAGRIYAFGGNDGTASSPAVFEYAPASDTWTQRASMTTPRNAATAVALGGRIYVMGGDPEKRAGTVEEYDPPTDTWTTKTPMYVARSYLAGVVVGDLAYVIGGMLWADRFRVGSVETYDPTKDE